MDDDNDESDISTSGIAEINIRQTGVPYAADIFVTRKNKAARLKTDLNTMKSYIHLNPQSTAGKTLVLLIILTLTVSSTSCRNDRSQLTYSLESAGSNRSELETVLKHFRNDPSRQEAARYIIKGLPAHVSLREEWIGSYYSYADSILSVGEMSPEEQRDSLLAFSDRILPDLENGMICDAEAVSAEFLIRSINDAWELWKSSPWASHLSYNDFLEWLLPYKMTELQSLDLWRDTLRKRFSDDLTAMPHDDVEYGTALKTADVIRNEVLREIRRYGLYDRSGLPLLSAGLLPRQTFGDIPDYALTGALALRAAGVPVVLDETPVGARGEAATRWFVVLGDKGSEEASEWDVATAIGWGFFPYERGPKVFRNTWSIDRRRWRYRRKAKFVYPFSLAKKDVTDRYFRTSDLSVEISGEMRRLLKDRYVYIASAVRDTARAQRSRSFTDEFSQSLHESALPMESGWCIVDFGKMKYGRAEFGSMGREVLYRVFGFDGDGLIPVTSPFILHGDGSIERISADTLDSPSLDRWKNNPLL